LRLKFSVRAVDPRGPLRRRPGEALILAPTHEHVLDPWLAVIAFDYRTWRSLAPVRVLGTRDWTGWYRARELYEHSPPAVAPSEG